MPPPLSGSHNAIMPGARVKETGGVSTMRQPSALTSMARQRSSQRSR
jgi:hypothetical protein